MPLYEFKCRRCSAVFEVLIRAVNPDPPSCRSCGNSAVDRLVSLFAVDSEASRQTNVSKRKNERARELRDKAVAQQEYAKKHIH